MGEPMPWTYDDGGRRDAGYRGTAADCACRAIAIATGRPYQVVYDLINVLGRAERPRKPRRNGKRPAPSSARTGVHKATTRRIMAELGWAWYPLMGIGTGCQVHLAQGEVPCRPGERVVVQLSGHVAAVVNGVVRDTHDPGRGGTRCIYGYWYDPAFES